MRVISLYIIAAALPIVQREFKKLKISVSCVSGLETFPNKRINTM